MTLICHAKKFIFLKTRKTAGTAVEVALQRYCAPGVTVPERTGFVETPSGIIGSRKYDGAPAPVIEHMPASLVRDYVGAPVWNAYLKISVVRNPYEKLVSEYWWQRKRSPRLSEADRIRDFRRWVASDERKWTRQDRKILAIDGKVAVDFVVRQETLEADVAALGAKLGLDDLVIAKYKSGVRDRSIPLRAYYDAPARAYAREEFAFEFEAFGYDPALP